MSDPSSPSSSTQASVSAIQAPSDRSTRPSIVGEDAGPTPPFPIYLAGTVQRGFGRGGKDLGCPTANLPSKLLQKANDSESTVGSAATTTTLADAPTGIYFGWARLLSEDEGGRGHEYEDREKSTKDDADDGAPSSASTSSKPLSAADTRVHPMVMSLGWNPFYANKTKTAEVHIMHPFQRDFYGLQIKVIVLGYIRPEYNYVDVEALKDDIETDKKVATRSLERSAYAAFETDPFFTTGTKL